MRIIGTYKSQLSDFFLQQLIAIAQKAAAAGEYGGGELLDAAAVAELKRQASDFASVPFVSAGARATEESLQQAVGKLSAKFIAMAEERNDFLRQMNLYLSVLRQDNQLVEALIRRADFERWCSQIPYLYEASQFSWDFGISPGTVPADPVSDDVDLVTRKELADTEPRQGITCAHDTQSLSPSAIRWIYTTGGQKEELYGSDWARLALLETAPRTNFGAPAINVVLPSNGFTSEDWMSFFSVAGNNTVGNVPVYVRNVFLPRRVFKTVNFAGPDAAEMLSVYRVSPDEVVVYDDFQAYFQGFDYRLTDSVSIEPLKRLVNRAVTVGFTEYFPAYQCSIDGQTWSTPVMLDPDRTAPDTAADEAVVSATGGLFPITDEIGNPTGMTIAVKRTVATEFTVCIQNTRPTGDSAFGAPAVLELEFDRPMFLNGVHLEPFVNFPLQLRGIHCESILGSNPGYVWQGNYLIDRAQDVVFAKREVLKMRLEFFQVGYTLKNHLVNVANRDKLEAMVAIQSVLPYQVRNTNYPLTREYSGCQYEFGMRDIRGLASDPVPDVIFGKQPVFYNGPFRVTGKPDVIRIDADVLGPVVTSIVSREYAADGTVRADVETVVTPGESIVYTPVSGTPSAVEFFVKFKLPAGSMARRFFLQVK